MTHLDCACRFLSYSLAEGHRKPDHSELTGRDNPDMKQKTHLSKLGCAPQEDELFTGCRATAWWAHLTCLRFPQLSVHPISPPLCVAGGRAVCGDGVVPQHGGLFPRCAQTFVNVLLQMNRVYPCLATISTAGGRAVCNDGVVPRHGRFLPRSDARCRRHEPRQHGVPRIYGRGVADAPRGNA